jgi:hypothetical protein
VMAFEMVSEPEVPNSFCFDGRRHLTRWLERPNSAMKRDVRKCET